MNSSKYLEIMKNIHRNILIFIEDPSNIEENYQNIIILFEEQKIGEDVHELKLIFNLLINIMNNHYHTPNFFSKIGKLILYFQEDIKKNFTNNEIIQIFESNKRILLFLIEENIIDFDKSFYEKVNSNADYREYFIIETMKYEKKNHENKYENFQELRRIGQNHHRLSEIIRKDLIEEFIIYVNKNDVSLLTRIESSIFETNNFLINKNPTLIEYAAFFGSVQIYKYLYKNDVKETPSLWLYSIHSDNEELIHTLEENGIKPYNENYEECYKESIKCHHNDVVAYIESNYINEDKKKKKLDNFAFWYQYYNFLLFQDVLDEDSFLNLINYNYYTLIKYLLCENFVDINKKILVYDYKLNNADKIDKFYKVITRSTALNIACEKGDLDILNLISSHPNIDFNAKRIKSYTYFLKKMNNNYSRLKEKKIIEYTNLQIAIENKNIDTINFLLKNQNIDLNAMSMKKHEEIGTVLSQKPPLFHAIHDDALMKILISSPIIDVNAMKIKKRGTISYEKPLLYEAIEKKLFSIVKIMLSCQRIDVNLPCIHRILFYL